MHTKSTNNAKRSFPRGAINRKYTFSQWILQFLRCNKYPQNGNWYFCNGSCKLPRANCKARMRFFVEMGGPMEHFSRILHRSSLQNYAWHRGRGALFQKTEQHLAENCGLSNISRNGAADDTRNAHPRRAISKKYTLFQWILQILRCTKYPK